MDKKINEILQPGDVVFISIPNFLYRRVEIVTDSWTSHVGMVHSFADGEWQVAESAVPLSKLCPLSKFVARSRGGLFCARRLKEGLSEQDIAALQQAAQRRLKKIYGFGFKFESKRQFCSKFVYEIYKEVKNIDLGRLETFGEIFEKNPQTSKTFWRYWFLGRIPWNQKTVTPASQCESDIFETVYSNVN